MTIKSRICPTADGGVKNNHSGRDGDFGMCADISTIKLGTVGTVSCHSHFGGRIGNLQVKVKLKKVHTL